MDSTENGNTTDRSSPTFKAYLNILVLIDYKDIRHIEDKHFKIMKTCFKVHVKLRDRVNLIYGPCPTS